MVNLYQIPDSSSTFVEKNWNSEIWWEKFFNVIIYNEPIASIANKVVKCVVRNINRWSSCFNEEKDPNNLADNTER